MLLLEVIRVLLLLIATGYLSLVYWEIRNRNAKNVQLSWDRSDSVDVAVNCNSQLGCSPTAAEPRWSFAQAGSAAATASTKRNGKADKRYKGKGELTGMFLFPLSWEVHGKSVADVGLEWRVL